ncbi:MAG: DUF928 domain-containing protein [Microcoleus sp. PH2017_06_SFM_O_A]|nr:DUF928 domain-containing protein [Microcoleus sp. PH2017_06_SFM_O_A]
MMTHGLKRRTIYSAGIASLILSVSFWIPIAALAKYTPPPGHPTFTWFVPDRTSRPLQLRLFTRSGQLLYRTEMESQPGIMSVALPANLPPLSIGQSYQWGVAVRSECSFAECGGDGRNPSGAAC